MRKVTFLNIFTLVVLALSLASGEVYKVEEKIKTPLNSEFEVNNEEFSGHPNLSLVPLEALTHFLRATHSTLYVKNIVFCLSLKPSKEVVYSYTDNSPPTLQS